METCPICGYKERNTNEAVTHIMNKYVNKLNPSTTGVFPSNKEELTQTIDEQEVTWIREDIYLKKSQVKSGTPILSQPKVEPKVVATEGVK